MNPTHSRGAILVAVVLFTLPVTACAQSTPKQPAAKGSTAGPAAAPAPAAKSPAAKSAGPAIATLFGNEVTRADLGPAPPVLDQMAAGDAAKRKELEARWEAQALTGLVLGSLLDQYAAEQKIAPTPAELSELMHLAAVGAKSPEAVAAGAAPPDTNSAPYRQAATGVIARFKINAAIYNQYGGTVLIDPQAGPMPFGSYQRFLEAKQKAGAFTVAPEWKERFWSAFVIDPGQPVVPEAEARATMNTPWWREGAK